MHEVDGYGGGFFIYDKAIDWPCVKVHSATLVIYQIVKEFQYLQNDIIIARWLKIYCHAFFNYFKILRIKPIKNLCKILVWTCSMSSMKKPSKYTKKPFHLNSYLCIILHCLMILNIKYLLKLRIQLWNIGFKNLTIIFLLP